MDHIRALLSRQSADFLQICKDRPSQMVLAIGAGMLTAHLIQTQISEVAQIRRFANPTYLPSPRKSGELAAQEGNAIPYPSNALPGQRDVETPYGSIRVYEWGAETGRKVLCVHGITTPCIAYAAIAKRLVEDHGCRVMLFDLFGRGYSDCPDPSINPQNMQLFTTQILLVLQSSELAWTGADRFSLLGYSLGGGIAAAFTSWFPNLVETLVLIAPAGLIRGNRINTPSRFLYRGLIPSSVMTWMVRRRLQGGGTASDPVINKAPGNPEATISAGNALASEMPGRPALAPNAPTPLFPDRPNMSIAQAVGWQLVEHSGFVPAFISSVRFGPIQFQHERWRLIGHRQRSSRTERRQTLNERKVLILLGKSDPLIVADQLGSDAKEVFGAEHVKVVLLDGAHDVPMINAEGCVDEMVDFWTKSKVTLGEGKETS